MRFLFGQGTASALLAVRLSVPGMQSLQYGQFQMPAITCALAAMLAFERERDALGGSLRPEVRVPFVADNLSLAGVVAKLHELRVSGMTAAVGLAALRVYTVLLLAFTLVAGRRTAQAREEPSLEWRT